MTRGLRRLPGLVESVAGVPHRSLAVALDLPPGR
jgi:hypothetical protein